MKPIWLYFDTRESDLVPLTLGRLFVLGCELPIRFLHYPTLHETAFQQFAAALERLGALQGVIIEDDWRREGIADFIHDEVRRFSATLPVWIIGAKQRPKEPKRTTLDARWPVWQKSILDEFRRFPPSTADLPDDMERELRTWGREYFKPIDGEVWTRERQLLTSLTAVERQALQSRLLDLAGYEISGPGVRRKQISLGEDVTLMYHHLPTGLEIPMRGFGQHGKSRQRLFFALEAAAEFRQELELPRDQRLDHPGGDIVHALIFHDVVGYQAPLAQLSPWWTEPALRAIVDQKKFHPLDEECNLLL